MREIYKIYQVLSSNQLRFPKVRSIIQILKKTGNEFFDKEAVDLHIDYNGKFANRYTPEKSVAFGFFQIEWQYTVPV